jgi:hypothetical protein
MLEKILNFLFHKQPIYREDKELYLMRWYWNFKFFTFKIHKFINSDDDCLHDHPWNFISIILKTGYNEVSIIDPKKIKHNDNVEVYSYTLNSFGENKKQWAIKRFYGPGSIIFHKATHTHRVELINNTVAWTIVFTGKRIRSWGFRDKLFNWHYWRDYVTSKNCG